MMNFESIVNPISGAVTILTGLLVGATWFYYRWWHRPVTVRFTRGTGRQFQSSFDLYKANFPSHETDEIDEVRRWLAEHLRLRAHGHPPLAEYWVSSFRKGRARGLLYGTLYTHSATLFVSYLVIDRNLKATVREQLWRSLFTEVRNEISRDGHQCETIVAEVAHPGFAVEKKIRRRRRGRIRRLIDLAARAHLALVVLEDAPYVQPRLDIDDHTKCEEPMLLLYGSVAGPVPKTLRREEVAAILRFVYEHLYGDCFTDDPGKDARWRAYLDKLCSDAITGLPPTIHCARKPELNMFHG